MSPRASTQAAQATATAATSQNNDTKKQNEKIFHLFLKKLASPNPPVYTEACRKLAQWLNDARAYYPEALSWILKLLLRAQRTLSEQAGVTGKSPFHISLAGSNPFAPEYRDLVNTVAKYRAQFVNTEFLEHLDLFCRSVDDRFAVKSSKSTPPTPHTDALAAPPNAVMAQPPRTQPISTKLAPPATNPTTVTVTASTSTTVPAANPLPKSTSAQAAGRGAGVGGAGEGEARAGEAGAGEGFVRGAPLITAKHIPKSPPKAARPDNPDPLAPSATSSTLTSKTNPTLNAVQTSMTPIPTPVSRPTSNTPNPTPTLTSKPATRLSTSTPHSNTPSPNPNTPTPTPTTLAPKAGGVKLRRRNMPRADILDADDEDARRRLEAAKLPGITVDRRAGLKKRGSGSGSGSGRGGGGGGGSGSTAKSPSIPVPASATHTGAAGGAGVNERTPEAARVKAEVADERTPALSVSQGPGSESGSREATSPLQGQVAPPVPLKSEPAPSALVQPDGHSAIPLESRSPHPAPGVEAMLADGEGEVTQSAPPQRVASQRAEPAPQGEEPRESTSAPPERAAGESVETVPNLQMEEQPEPTENKVVAADPEVQASDEPVVSEALEEPRPASNTEVEAEAKANDEPVGAVETPKVAEDEGLKSPLSLSTTESRGSTSTPFALRFQLSQAVFTSPSSISGSPERGPSIVHENTPLPLATVVPLTDPTPAADAVYSEIPSEIPHVSAHGTPQPQAEPAAAPTEERRSQSVASERHASLPMSPRFLEAQMEVVADGPSLSTSPSQIQQPRRSLSASASAPETASHDGLPMSLRFLESQMHVVGDGDVDVEEGEGAKPVVATETISVDPPLQPKNDDLSEEAPVRSYAPDVHEDPDIAGTVAAPLDPDVPNVASYGLPVSTDDITNVSEGDGAEQALVSSSQEDAGNTEAVKEEVSPQEQPQQDDGVPMDVDFPEAMGGSASEPVKDDLPEPEQSMDVDADEGGGESGGEGDAGESIVPPTLEDGEELEADGGTLDAPVITPAPLEPAIEEKEEGEVRVSPCPVDVLTYSSTPLDPNNEDEEDTDNVTRGSPSESTYEKARSTPDTAQEVQPEHVDEDQARDIPEEPVNVQHVQDGTSTSTSASASFVNASESSSVSAKEPLSDHSHDDQGSSVNETNEAEQASQASTSVNCKLSEQSRDDPGTSVNTNDTDHTSPPPSVASAGGLSEQFRDDQATSAKENDHISQSSSASTNDDPSAQFPRGSGTSVDGGIPLAAEHDSNVCDDAGLPGRQESPLESNGKKPHIVDVAGQDGKDESGDAVDVRTSAEAPFASIDGGADASVSGVSYSDKAGLDQSISIETDLHQVNNNVPSDNPNFSSTPNPVADMDTTSDAPTQAVDVPINDPVPVSDDRVVQPMFRPGVTILGILTGNEENAKATSRFVLQNEIEALLAQWRRRYKTQVDMTNAASVSLACYRSKDMAETLSVVGTSPDAASEFVNSCPQTWPTDGSLSVGMFYDGKRQFIPLAPPLLPTHDRFLDVSQFVHEGDNTFELEFGPSAKIYTCILFAHHPTQTQLADVALRRKSKVLWAQQLSSCFRPLEIPAFVF
ncbi:hypothetical protein PTI98_002680 [Pleurotus ostreatus]|nr:hypothetical protein PTI98_002680 [Pleurotus ostreatus]